MPKRKKPEVIETILEDGAELTVMQRAFCEAYVVDPSNASEAARKAGAAEGSANVQASKWLAMPHVQAYIAELRSRAVEKEPAAVADLSEALAGATTVLRTELADYKVTTPANGRDYRGAIKAAEVLVKHYDALETPKQGVTINWLQILGELDPQTREALRAAWVKALPQTVEAG